MKKRLRLSAELCKLLISTSVSYFILALPCVTTIFASANSCIVNLIFSGAGSHGTAYILFLAGNCHNQFYGEKAYPHKQVYDPPPRTDENPPYKPVPLLLVFRFRLCNSCRTFLFLKCLNRYIFTFAFWTSHVISSFLL